MIISAKELPVEKYTLNDEIYSLRDEIHDDGEYYFINRESGFDKDHWTIEEAIAYYLSPKGAEDRENAFYSAWGFWD